MLRAAIYPRVSGEEQAKFGLSIHDQQHDLEKYAKEHGMKIVGVFSDAGYSARKKIEQRPAMMELLEAVKRDEVDIILVTKLDRWFRNIGEYYKVQEILEAHHVAWKTIYEDYDTSTASGRLKINIMLAVAQDEADRTSERIKKVFEAKRMRNEPCTGHVPTGYLIEGKKVIIDKALEPHVRKFFATFLETGSVQAAILAVPELHLQYQSASKMLYGEGYRGEWHGIKVPPYLTEEEFAAIKRLRKRITRKSPNNYVFLFSGLVVCGECGKRMGARHKSLPNGRYSDTYNCTGHYQYKGCGSHVNIMEKTIEAYLLESIDDKIRILATMKDAGESTIDPTAKIAAIKKKMSKLADLYMDDMISKSEYTKRYTEMTQQLDDLELARALPKRSKEELSELFFDGWKDIYVKLSRENKRAFWKLKIKEIRVYADRRIDFDFL